MNAALPWLWQYNLFPQQALVLGEQGAVPLQSAVADGTEVAQLGERNRAAA